MEDPASSQPPFLITARVRNSFLILTPSSLLEPLENYLKSNLPQIDLFQTVVQGLHSVVSSASLPFQLIQNSVYLRRFDGFHKAAAIRNLQISPDVVGKSDEEIYNFADQQMKDYVGTTEGSNFMRDSIIYSLHSSLRSPEVSAAAQELLVQTLISTWSVFETFARQFIISWINENPRRISPLLASPDLKDFFGKQAVDIQTIGEHGFDLSSSMGEVLFRGRRLDSLGSIRSVMKAIFNSSDIQTALGEPMQPLNQRRHLFVHHRGIVDREYLKQTADTIALGERILLTAHEIEAYLFSVQRAVLAIAAATRNADAID